MSQKIKRIRLGVKMKYRVVGVWDIYLRSLMIEKDGNELFGNANIQSVKYVLFFTLMATHDESIVLSLYAGIANVLPIHSALGSSGLISRYG